MMLYHFRRQEDDRFGSGCSTAATGGKNRVTGDRVVALNAELTFRNLHCLWALKNFALMSLVFRRVSLQMNYISLSGAAHKSD